MQQLQETVLNAIQPGVNPVFIVAPNITDGESLALLLSNHLVTQNNLFTSPPLNSNNNFFISEELDKLFSYSEKKILKNNIKIDNKINTSEIKKASHKIILTPEEVKKKKKKENLSFLEFILERGLDSKQLWGLQLDYDFFLDFEINKIYPDAYFIFLYGTAIKSNLSVEAVKNKKYSERIYDFYCANKQSSILLHVNDVYYIPEIVLENLYLDSNTNFRPFISNKLIQKKNIILSYNSNNDESSLKDKFDKNNLITINNAWFNGNEIINIIILNDFSNIDNLINKIDDFYNSFLSAPGLMIVCKNENEKRYVQKLLENIKIYKNINILACHTNIATLLNESISGSSYKYILIDHSGATYFNEHLLSPFKKAVIPSFVIGNLKINKINEDKTIKISLADVLTINTIPESILIPIATWNEVSGFDITMDNNSTIWDFVIRSLKLPNSFGLEVEINHINGINKKSTDSKYDIIEKRLIPYEVYKIIIDKHKSLFEQYFNKVIKTFSENQHIPEYEILKLSTNISSLNSVISHSKHEIKSLNTTRTVLQNHINLLESRWYFKLGRKLNHLKGIFFKEKGSGKNIIIQMLKFLFFIFTKPGLRIIRKLFKGGVRKLYLLVEERPVKIVYLDNSGNEKILNYDDWIKNKLDPHVLKKDYNKTIDILKIKPKLSVIVPVYNPPIDFLNDAILSVINQSYENWELCIADDCSPNPQIKRLLQSFTMKDSRIKVVFREDNGHISAASNSAISIATGDYIMLLDHDDLLTPNAMFEIVKHINEHPEDKFIYSDEDKVQGKDHYSDPFFKPDWSPDRFLAINYISHLVTIDKKLIDAIGGFRLGLEGSQDYDLFLRLFELTSKIGHIPKVLYHWRIHSASVASDEGDVKPYAYIAAKKALEEALVRRNIPGEVQYLASRGSYRIKYQVESFDKVSIIIPTKDHTQLMKNTIDSIYSLTNYPNYEVIVLNNNSTSKDFFELMDEYKQLHPDTFKCIEASFPFNFSKLINLGVSVSKGKYILMLNNDVEILQPDWVTNMVSYCQHPQTGCVGVKLLYPNDTIQHAGTVIGLGAGAGHIYVGSEPNRPGYYNCLQTVTNYSAVTAACLMCRKDVFDKVNGMDELLAVEYNDVDFCLSVLESGYYNLYLPDVTLYHYESTTRGHPSQNKSSHERHIREISYFKEKWEKYLLHGDPFYNPNFDNDFNVDLTK